MASVEKMKGWAASFANDVELVMALVEDDKAPESAREFAAAALQYLLTRMDLIPDWEETTGILDDAMVVRVAMALAADEGLGEPDSETMQGYGRLANEAEVVSEFLGPEMFPRLRKLVKEFVHNEVRGRRATSIVKDEDLRKLAFQEVERDLVRLPPAPMSDLKAVEASLRSYFSHKLK